MQEDLLHYLWRFKKVPLASMCTTTGERIEIFDFGTYNTLAGPDIFNSRIQIGKQLWAGNVEMHLRSSDWFAHRHQEDSNYDNVILHVVWEDDMEVYRKDGSPISTLVLKPYVSQKILEAYRHLKEGVKSRFILCEGQQKSVNPLIMHSWLERIFIERLEQKMQLVHSLLNTTNNNWEAVLFALLLKAFGTKVNAEAFFRTATRLDFKILRKLGKDSLSIESLFLGLMGLLQIPDPPPDPYYHELVKTFHFLKRKFKLPNEMVRPPEFYGLRPSNFPTIRLSQLADLYARKPNLFRDVVAARNLKNLREHLSCTVRPYWQEHYTFAKTSSKRQKKLSTSFKDIIILNAVLPLTLAYQRSMGRYETEYIFALAAGIRVEKNTIVDKFASLNFPLVNALQSQSVLQLYNQYCREHRCLQCAVGTTILNIKS